MSAELPAVIVLLQTIVLVKDTVAPSMYIPPPSPLEFAAMVLLFNLRLPGAEA